MIRFTVLFVCSANLCRSVTAAALTSRSLHQHPAEATEWDILSAGLDVRAGASLPRRTADAMRDYGIPLNRQPRQLDSRIVHDADLILTAERVQRARIVRSIPSSNRKTFTIRQFGRLCAAGHQATGVGFTGAGSELLKLAETGRALVQPVAAIDDNIVDPTSAGTESAMRECLSTIQDAIQQIIGE